MFRKPKNDPKKKRSFNKSSHRLLEKDNLIHGVDADDNDDEDDDMVHAKIRQAQKKQKLLSTLPVATGEVVVASSTEEFLTQSKSSLQAQQQPQPQEMTVLATKHQQAMEEFIQQQLIEKGKLPSVNQNPQQDQPPTNSIDSEKALLYQELAQSTVKSSHLSDQEQQQQQQKQQAQDDQDDKGAVLVGGTGIAEVILPKSFQYQNVATTNTTRGLSRVRNKNMASSSSSAVPDNARLSLPSKIQTPNIRNMIAVTHNASSISNKNNNDTLPLPSSSSSSPPKTILAAEGNSQDTLVADTTTTTQVDEDRPGFAAYRGTNRSTSYTKKRMTPQQRDNQAFVKFVQRQRDTKR